MRYSLTAEKSGESFVVKASGMGKIEGCGITFTFDDVIATKGQITSVVRTDISWKMKGGDIVSERFVQELSAFSSQSRESYARQLDKAFTGMEGFSSTLLLSDAVMAFSDCWKTSSASNIIRLSDAVSETPNWLIDQLVEDGSANLLYAMGGIGKTFLAMALMNSVVTGQPFLGRKPEDAGPTMIIDYEGSSSVAKFRMESLGSEKSALNDVYYYHPNGVPLHLIKDEVALFVRNNKIRLLVVDSAAGACGGEPENADVAARYFAALSVIGVTSLTIAHQSKNGNGDTAFGSVFWMNYGRNVNHLESVDNRQGDLRRLLLKHKKYNNGPLRADLPIIFKNSGGTMIYELDEAKPKKRSIAEIVVECLRREGEMSNGEIALSESLAYGSVRNVTREMYENGSLIKGTKRGKFSLAV